MDSDNPSLSPSVGAVAYYSTTQQLCIGDGTQWVVCVNNDNAVVNTLTANEITTGSLDALEVVTCDITVNCNIYMQDSISPSTGNIYKNGDSFIHNYGTDNTFVGKNAGNFVMTGEANSGFGVRSLISNSTGNQNTAVVIDTPFTR